MEGSTETVSLMMKGAGEGGVEKTKIKRYFFYFYI